MNRATRHSLQVTMVLALLAFAGVGTWWWSRPVLKLYIWDGYLPSSVVRKFSEEYHVRITVRTYTSNAEMLARVKVSWSEFDVIMPSNYIIGDMRRQNLLVKMSRADVPNMSLIQSEFRSGLLGNPDDLYYGIPYMLNYAGIGYDKKAVPNPPKTWREYFSREEEQVYGRKLLVLDEPRETIGLVLIALGYAPNSRNPDELKAARDFLHEEREGGIPRLVLGEGRELLRSGEGVLLQTWSPEITIAQEEDPNIGYVMPAEGSILTADTLAIPRSSSQQELAKQFINYLLRPDIAAEVTANSHYANSLDDKFDKVSPKMRQSPSYVSPPPGKIFYLTDLGDAQHLYDAIWAEYRAIEP